MKNTVLSLFLIFLMACSASIPNWYNKLPDKTDFLYAAGTERGDEIQNAVDEATAIAVANLGRMVETEISGMQARAQEEIRDRTSVDSFTNVQEEIYSVSLKDWRVAKQEIVKDKGLHRAYVLVEWNQAAAQERLLKQIEQDKQLYEAMRASDLMKEMQQKVEDYRKRKANQ